MMARIPDPFPVHLPELLAPAGSPEALRAAVAAGADAVYLSGKRFGARKYAANFSDDEIIEGIRLAHARGIRIYVTVNTLIHDRELSEVADYLIWLYAAGVDAVLVQDTGVASLAREIVPCLPLHASTQMTIHNTEGVRWAAGQGFSRVVLSRELPLAEIRTIAENTQQSGVGIEVFAHGALCYSYSGQCLLSSFIGGRSGNRGMCAQPCRKPYQLVTGVPDAYGKPEQLRTLPSHDRYLLSPKDLCTYRHLPELVSSPVSSLKIEGRMKSPEYVAIVVSAYRRALDAIAAGTWKPSLETEQDLLLAFNRGFTSGYLFGERHGKLRARDAPDNRGICIGTVTSQDRHKGTVTVHLNGTLQPIPGDGLLFVDRARKQEDWGFFLNNTPVAGNAQTITFIIPKPVSPGSSLFLTSSRLLEARAKNIISHPAADLSHKVTVDLSITVESGGHIRMEGLLDPETEKKIRVSCHSDFCLVPARSSPLSREHLEAQIRKVGNTPFDIRHCSIAYDGTLFCPMADLNRMRRDFFAHAEKELLRSSLPSDEDVAESHKRRSAAFSGPPVTGHDTRDKGSSKTTLTLTVYADTEETVSAALKEGCVRICFEPAFVLSRCSCRKGSGKPVRSVRQQVMKAGTLCSDAGALFILKLPRITRDEYLVSVVPEIMILDKDGLAASCMVENPGAARAIRTLMPDIVLYGAAGLNIFNHRSACRYSPTFRSLTLSPELSKDECRELVLAAQNKGCSASFALVVQGIGEAMVTEDCLLEPMVKCRNGERDDAFFGIQDGTGRIFPLWNDGECRTRIGNAVETCLVDHLPAIQKAGISEIVIDARGRTAEYAGAMTRIYLNAIEEVHNGTDPSNLAVQRKDAIKTLAFGGITTGHFLRGLKE